MAEDKQNERQKYVVTAPREIGGVHRKVDEVIEMTSAQAKYYLPPMGTGLKLQAATAPKAKAAKSEG